MHTIIILLLLLPSIYHILVHCIMDITIAIIIKNGIEFKLCTDHDSVVTCTTLCILESCIPSELITLFSNAPDFIDHATYYNVIYNTPHAMVHSIHVT
jgi:hypothetical protein